MATFGANSGTKTRCFGDAYKLPKKILDSNYKSFQQMHPLTHLKIFHYVYSLRQFLPSQHLPSQIKYAHFLHLILLKFSLLYHIYQRISSYLFLRVNPCIFFLKALPPLNLCSRKITIYIFRIFEDLDHLRHFVKRTLNTLWYLNIIHSDRLISKISYIFSSS